MGEDLRKQEQGPVAQYAAEIGDAVGGQVDRFASYLNGRDIHQLLSETRIWRGALPLFSWEALLSLVLRLADSSRARAQRPIYLQTCLTLIAPYRLLLRRPVERASSRRF